MQILGTEVEMDFARRTTLDCRRRPIFQIPGKERARMVDRYLNRESDGARDEYESLRRVH